MRQAKQSFKIRHTQTAEGKILAAREALGLSVAYISRKFEPAYIPVSAMNNIVLDMYPEQLSGKPLIAQMVELGKRIYSTDQLS